MAFPFFRKCTSIKCIVTSSVGVLGVIVIKGSKSNEVKKYISQENYGKQIITGVLAIQERQKCMVAVDTFNCTCLILAFNLPMALPFLHFLPLHIVSHFKSLMVVRFPSQPRPQGFSLLIFFREKPWGRGCSQMAHGLVHTKNTK